jgi:hypothetical protein
MNAPDPFIQSVPLNQPPPEPPKKRHTGLIIGLVAVGVLVLLTAAAVSAVVLGAKPKPTAAGATPRACGVSGVCVLPTVAAATTEAPPPKVNSFALGRVIETSSTGPAGKSATRWTVNADKQYSRSPDGYSRPKNGVFYAIRVDVSVSSGTEYVYSDDFAFIAPDGTAYQASSSTYGFPSYLNGTTLNDGQKVSGLVVFDVPQAAVAGAKIELRPNGQSFSGGDQAFWQLP